MHIPLFKDFYPKHNLDTTSGFVNKCIDESCHLVDEIEYVSMDICSLIRKGYTSKKKNSPVIFLDENKIGNYNCETFVFKFPKTIKLFDCNCQLDVKIINITDDISLAELRTICQTYCDAKIIRDVHQLSHNGMSPLNVEFILSGTIILHNLHMCPYMKSVISHETRHAFIFYKKYKDKTYDDISHMDENIKDWNKLYQFCENYIKNYNSRNKKYLSYGEENYFIIYSLYSCDVEEIDAFTQSAYEDIRNSKSISLVKSRMKDTDLWYTMDLLKEMIDKFGDDFKSRYDKFNTEICNESLPKYKTYKNLIEKRYRVICRNFGIVQMMLIDECEENMIVEKYDYYSVSVKGLYVDNRKYYL